MSYIATLWMKSTNERKVVQVSGLIYSLAKQTGGKVRCVHGERLVRKELQMKKQFLWSAWMNSLLGLSFILAIAGDMERSLTFLAIYIAIEGREQINDLISVVTFIGYRMYLRNKHDGIE